jgi:hypothetical protein
MRIRKVLGEGLMGGKDTAGCVVSHVRRKRDASMGEPGEGEEALTARPLAAARRTIGVSSLQRPLKSFLISSLEASGALA